jgi:hypothetical protein
MGRTLTIAFCTGMMCFALAGCGDDTPPQGAAPPPGERTPPPNRTPSTGQRLIIGPWTHGVPTLTRTAFRGVEFGPNAGIDFNEPQLRFFDYWLKQIDKGYST